MKKIGWMFVLLLLILLGAALFIWSIRAPLVSSFLTDKMRVPVSLQNISIKPSQTKIRNFQINNPKGFRREAAFEVNYADIDYDFHKLFRNPVEFDQIALDGVYLNIELINKDGSQNNWTAIGSNVAKNDNEMGKEVVIHKLVLTNITVEVSGLGMIAGLTVPKVQNFDRWEFNEIDSRHGFPTEELIAKIFGKAGVLQYIQGIFNQAIKIQKAVNPLRIFRSENGAVESDAKYLRKS